MAKTWFITGTSRGFGREWAQAALERGDNVAATARNTDSLKDLVEAFGDRILPIELDVTDRDADFAAVKKAHDNFGSLDVVINNAGYGLFGAVEEISEPQARAQMETNFFGLMWVTQAALPFMRAQNSGRILQVTSIGGIVAFPTLSLYHASKWAVEGFTQALAGEVAGFGIHVTLIEPTGYATDWAGSSAVQTEHLAAYDGVREERKKFQTGRKRGTASATKDAILTVVDSETPPLRLFLGEGPLELAKADYAKRISEWEQWNDVSVGAHGEPTTY